MANASKSDEFITVKGFRVEIDSSSGKEVDTAWESVTGGELIIELIETTVGADKFSTQTPGHKSVGEIVLRGPMTASRKWIAQHLTKPDLFNLTMVEIGKDGRERRFIYSECFVTRYIFPLLSTETTGNLYEEVRIKPVRCELK